MKGNTVRTFLHVGCGPARKEHTTAAFATDDWQELRFDIDQSAKPDIVGTMTDMAIIPNDSVDALFSAHNIEHLFPHEVPVALGEFCRVLKSDGFVVITCPDIQSVAALVAEGKLIEPAYMSAAGPIAPLDIMYGLRSSLAAGNHYMAHKCGFTDQLLIRELLAAGFASVIHLRRPESFDLWAVASKTQLAEPDMRSLAQAHLPH
jgi:SAM-dependent methyltransferase